MNPIRTPTKKPLPRVAAVGPKLSILGIILDAAPSGYLFSLHDDYFDVSLLLSPIYGNIDR